MGIITLCEMARSGIFCHLDVGHRQSLFLIKDIVILGGVSLSSNISSPDVLQPAQEVRHMYCCLPGPYSFGRVLNSFKGTMYSSPK